MVHPLTVYERAPVHRAMRILSIGTAVPIGLAISRIIWRLEAGGIHSFKDLENVVSIAETALGIYTGGVVDRLFGVTVPTPTGS